MGFLDKFFGRTSGNKIRIKFFSEKETVDEQEQFLISKKDISPSKPAARSNTENRQKKSDIAQKTDNKMIISVSADEPNITAKSSKNFDEPKTAASAPTRIDRKRTIPISEPDKDPDETGAVTVTEGKATRNGKFDIKKAKDGRYFFCLYASNYAVIAYSQIYSSSNAAMNGIKSIIANAGKTPIEDTTLRAPKAYPFPKWEIYIDRAGEYRFRLYAQNGLCICHSAHGYSTKSGCKGGIESIGRFASDAAKIDKKYLK